MKNRMDLVEIIERTAREDPERLALKSSAIREGITYRELDEYSASVYACLKEKGIGRDDIVVAVLPRDCHAIVAAIAVWKAGACITLVENTYAKERIEFIKRDSKASFVIDYDIFMEMLEHEPLYGHEIPGEHDACFIVYTSGSTGNPKGVLHEYGKIGMAVDSLKARAKPTPDGSLFAMVAPLNFLASYLTVFYIYALGKCAYILSYEVVKNPPVLAEVLLKEKISETFMTPTFLKAYRKASPYLINFFMGGESCNNVFIDGPNLINCYASSESGLPAASYVLTKLEEKVPSGKSIPEDLLTILDENGTPVAKGETGEICIRNYYTRGYLNLPDKNAETFRDGFCHMGDIGYLREDGNLMFSGRKDDMVKINGNRVEPGEIEEVLKRVLHIQNAVVKGFVDENRAYLCAYLLSDEMKNHPVSDGTGEVSAEKIKVLIQDYLPYYMVPTYYVLLEKYPVNANGKLSRKDLPMPDTDDYRSDYAAPENEAEKYFCDCFAAALKLDRVGANDDFYMIGGDSIAAAEFMSRSELPGLSVGDLYQYRTPRKLAAYYLEHYSDTDDRDERNQKAIEHPQPLIPEMLDMFGKRGMKPSMAWYLPHMLRFADTVNPERLKKAINKVFRHHSALNSVVCFSDDASLRIRYAPELYPEIEVQYVTEDKFAAILNTPTALFNVINAPLYQAVIYRTPSSTYLFLNFFHAIIDGTSVGVLMNEVQHCYEDDSFTLDKDYYYLYLHDREKNRLSQRNNEAREYYISLFQKNMVERGIPFALREDRALSCGLLAVYEGTLSKSKAELKRSSISEYIGNGLFMISYLLAIASMNGKNGAYLEWIYNGRDSLDVSNQVGLLFRTLSLAVSFDENETLSELAEKVKEQMDFTLAHPDVRMKDVIPNMSDRVCAFLYQKNIYSTANTSFIDGELTVVETPGEFYQNIECEFMDSDESDEYTCVFNYRQGVYTEESIKEIFRRFDRITGVLADSQQLEKLLIRDILKNL